MGMIVYRELEQGTDEWRAARCGLLTASEMKLIITPSKLQYASNDKERAHVYELAAQRVTKHVEPAYMNDDMLSGIDDEVYAREEYRKHYGDVQQVGFITNDKWGFTLGYSPDGLVGKDGVMEVKSRRQKYQLETIIDIAVPSEHTIQIQTGLLVSERSWCDYVSYCGGMPMATIRVAADAAVQAAILTAAEQFHKRLEMAVESYTNRVSRKMLRLVPTERRVEQEMVI